MRMRRGGYDSYHGRSRVRTVLKVLIGILLVVLIAAVAAAWLLQPYVRYSSDGVRLDLPFAQETPGPQESVPVVLTTPEVTATAEPTPTPEAQTPLHGLLLPDAALYDGTAAQQLEAAGANAAVFDMKKDDGTLAYISQQALAVQAQVSSADPAINAAIQLLNSGEVYTVARVSCFRDNAVPRTDMDLALHTSRGNWRDTEDYRWLSPANATARQYVVGVCRELAALGFDEILLDNCAFPTQGELSWLITDANYDPEGRTEALTAFFQELQAALADYPEVRVSVVTTAAVLNGQEDGSGQTAQLLEAQADRVCLTLAEGETLPTLGDIPVVEFRTQAGGADENWVIRTQV